MVQDPARQPEQASRNLSVREIGLSPRLRARRLAAGLSRQELADRAGITERTVRDIENEKRARIQDKTLMLLADALGCEPGDLAVLPPVPPASPRSADAPGAAAPGRRRPRWPLALAAATAAIVLLAAVLGWYAVEHATWEVVEGDLFVRDAMLGRILWTLDDAADVRMVVPSPWEASLFVGFVGNASDGAQVWRVNRFTGGREAAFALDESAVRLAYGDEILAEGQHFSCSAIRFMEYDGDGQHELVVRYTHGKYYPAGLAVYERDGEPLAQYVNRGHISLTHIEDLDQDGRDELLAFGTNNDPAYQGATAIYLEEGAWSGAAVDPSGGPGRGPVGDIADGARYRLVLPSWGSPVMEQLHYLRLTAMSPTTHRLDDGRVRIVFTAGTPQGGASVVCDARLRPLLANATDSIKGEVGSWPEGLRGPDAFPSQPWLDRWLEGARWSRLGSDELVFGPRRPAEGDVADAD